VRRRVRRRKAMPNEPNDPAVLPPIQAHGGEWIETTSAAVVWLERWLTTNQLAADRVGEVREMLAALREYWGRKPAQLPDLVRGRLAELVARVPFKY
jgi:hypothetical protein